jgi:hypothetical protein
MTVYERKASDSEEEMDSNNNNNSMDMDLWIINLAYDLNLEMNFTNKNKSINQANVFFGIWISVFTKCRAPRKTKNQTTIHFRDLAGIKASEKAVTARKLFIKCSVAEG